MPAELLKRIRARTAVVGVVGLGYVGLPHARMFANRGFRVVGLDIDPNKVRALNEGRSYVGSVPSSDLTVWRREGLFEATSSYAKLRDADAVILCVPTPLAEDGRPDLSFVRDTARAVGKVLQRGRLVVLESTTYPGTTREVVKPELEQRGLKCGQDFLLAFSPEREDPGNKDWTAGKVPKVVGGFDEASLRAASALYGAAVDRVVEVSSLEVAEAEKLLENIYRCVNIALVNELKMCFDKMGIDVWEVIEAAATKPFGFQKFTPGPGMGGHCIPIDPFYLTWRAREYGFETRFINLAGEINTQMPFYVVERLKAALKRPLAGAKILVLGLAYKKDIDDPRESPSWKIMDLLVSKGACVAYNDPYIPKLPKTRHWSHLELKHVKLTPATLRAQDAVILLTDHTTYDAALIAKHAKLIVDTRNVFRGVQGNVVKA
ncbi:MAG: nucleotide sugar dehydrogenase [Planctomycetes bacterium]|nr:nucleotide sugar dehydrogenase [Planctomycetota bacterium]